MTPEQEQRISDVKTRVYYLSAGGTPQRSIRAALVSEGWPMAAINEVMPVGFSLQTDDTGEE